MHFHLSLTFILVPLAHALELNLWGGTCNNGLGSDSWDSFSISTDGQGGCGCCYLSSWPGGQDLEGKVPCGNDDCGTAKDLEFRWVSPDYEIYTTDNRKVGTCEPQDAKRAAFSGALWSCGYISDWRCSTTICDEPTTPPPTNNPDPGTLRFMIVGDSISQGWEGDYTWRYRLWERMQSQKMDVDFVGPYKGTMKTQAVQPGPYLPRLDTEPEITHPPGWLPLPYTDGAYAKDLTRTWPTSHYSVWGRQAKQDKDQIQGYTTTHYPDFILVELGFNDLGWFVDGPEGTLASMKKIVDEARAAKPDVSFVLANVPDRTFIEGRDDLPVITAQYNKLLADSIATWSTSQSPIRLAYLNEAYDCDLYSCPASHDGLHPNSLGEYQIARAFSSALHTGFDLGTVSLDGPGAVPDRPTPVPSNFRVESVAYGLRVTWDPVFGAYSYDIRHRQVGGDWQETTVGIATWSNSWVLDGQNWEAQVRTNNGDTLGYTKKSDWTSVKSVAVHPTTPKGPTDTTVKPTSDGFTITFEDSAGNPDRYEVAW